jgi:carbonic anhydrase
MKMIHTRPTTPCTHWGYAGPCDPEHWGGLEPDFATCGEGVQQSPVDIPADAPLNPDDVVYAYRQIALSIVNNGHAIQVNCGVGSTIEIDGTTYALQQFHFHSPSEHTLAGENMAMEMHLVHADADGNKAVIGVLLTEGAENPAFAPIVDNMPVEEGASVTIADVFINADDLLPVDRSYYRYIGSLTTPPCTEGVLWHILAQPVAISAAQLAAFRALYDGTNRPIQPMNDRAFLAPAAG